MDILGTVQKLAMESGFAAFFITEGGWKNLVMILIAFVLLYLGIAKKFEPLLLCGIAFGCLLSNLSYFIGMGENAMYHPEMWAAFLDQTSPYYHSYGHIMAHAGLLDFFYIGVKAGIYPSLIFMGVGAMTDFGPLLSNPKSLLLGAAAQLGVFVAFFGAVLLGFTGPQAASIGIIGGADGPTAIFLTTKLAPELLGPIAIAAYSYMALIPMIQPPIMKLMTTEKMRVVKMEQTREVSKAEKIVFPILVATFVILLPSVRHGAERADEHRHDLPRDLCRRDDGGAELPELQHDQDHRPRPDRLRDLHDGRSDRRHHHVQDLRRPHQSADRLGGRVRGADGRAREPGRGTPLQQVQLPADARHGPERGRRHRLGHRGRFPALRVRRLSAQKTASRSCQTQQDLLFS